MIGRAQDCCRSLRARGALVLTGCGNIEPWVKPYERQSARRSDHVVRSEPGLHRRTSTTCSKRAKARAARWAAPAAAAAAIDMRRQE